MEKQRITAGEKKTEQGVTRLSEILYLCFWSLMLFAKGIGLYDGQTAYKLILIAAVVAWTGKMCLTAYTKKEFIIVVLLLLLGAMTYLISGEKGALIYILMVTGLKNVSVKRVFITGAWVWTISFVGMALLNMAHIIDGPFKVHEKLGMDMIIRWGLGQSHPNVLHISYLVFVMLLVYLQGERFGLKAATGFMLGNILVFLFSLSSTGVITVTFYLAICLYMHYRKKMNWPEQFLVKLIFPIILLYSFAAPLVLKGELYERINDLSNTRLNLAKYFLTLKAPTVFGNKISEIITSQLTMDNSYVNAYVTYGILFAAAAFGGYFVLIRNCCRKDKNNELTIILACLVAGIMEPFLFNTSFKNISLLFAGELLYTQGKEETLKFFSGMDKEISLRITHINKVEEAFCSFLKKSGYRIAGVCLLFALIGGTGYYVLKEEPTAVIVPRKDIDVAVLKKHPELESVYLDSVHDEVKKDAVVYGYQDEQTEMIICLSKNLITMEKYRGTVTAAVITGLAAFMGVIIGNGMKEKRNKWK